MLGIKLNWHKRYITLAPIATVLGLAFKLRDPDHLIVAHENNPDPAMRPYKEPISAERREDLIVHAIAGVTRIYRYFEAQRSLEEQSPGSTTTFLRTTPKIGRNDPCPCGSGKKFKRCCSKTTFR